MKLHSSFCRSLLLASLLLSSAPFLQAQDPATTLLTGLTSFGGYAIGKAITPNSNVGPAVGASVLPALTTFGYEAYKSKAEEEKLKYYIAGRNYERWIRSQNIWYQSTLDPTTGRPPAFTGLNAMDTGMPAQTAAQTDSNAKDDLNKVYTVPVRVPQGTYDGVPHTEHIRAFPKLP